MRKLTALVFVLLAYAPAWSQPRAENLRVATRLVKPFVFEEKGQLTGFTVDLWQEITKQMNVQSEFIVKPTVKDLLAGVYAHEAALGIAAISITAEREMQWDFSQPMFDAGLQILTSAQSGRGALVKTIFANLFSSAVLPYVLGVASIL